jgi:hypothetical protein
VLRFSDARNFGRTATGLLLIVGPLLLLVGSIVGPDTGDGNSVKDKLHELATVQAHKGSFLLGNIIFMTAGLCLVLAGFGLVKYFKGPRGVTLGQVAGVFLALGSTAMMGWYALGSVELAMVQHHSEALLNTAGTRLVYATLIHATGDAGAGMAVFIVLFLVGILVGQILLGIAAIRTRVVPVWAGALLIISGLGSFFGGDNRTGQIITGIITLAALGILGWRALQMSDEEWDAPLVRGGVPASAADAAPAPAPAV